MADDSIDDDDYDDDQDVIPYSTSPNLSINQAVQFIIEGDSNLRLPRAYELVAGGTIFDRLQYCCEKAAENYANHRPDELRSKIDLKRANQAIYTANKYLFALQNALPAAREKVHPLLQWDEHASKQMNCDMFLKGSIIAWIYHTFDVNPYDLYTPASAPERTQLASSQLTGQPALHEEPQADQTPATPELTTVSSAGTSEPVQDEAHLHTQITVYLVADALSRHLNTFEENDSHEEETDTGFGNNEGVIHCAKIAHYLVEYRRLTRSDMPSDQHGLGVSPTNTIETGETLLCFLTQTLAELLDKAIADADLEIWRDQAKSKMENFIKGDGTYTSAAIQRYLSKYILLSNPFPGQAERAIQQRLNAAKDRTTDQGLLRINEQDITLCLGHAAQQFNQAKTEVERKAQAEARNKALADRVNRGPSPT